MCVPGKGCLYFITSHALLFLSNDSSIVDCGLKNISFEFTDGSGAADSALSTIDLRHNALSEFPSALYSLPSTISAIDLRGNDKLSLSTETAAHKKQLATWIDDTVLKADDVVVATLDSSNPNEGSSIMDVTSTGGTKTESKSGSSLPTSSSGSGKSVTSTRDGDNMNAIPITIVAVMVPAVLAVGITLAFVVRKRRQMQDRDTDAILDFPHPFGKSSRDRSETSGNFTIADSELSRSRMSSGDIDHHDVKDRDSCAIAVTPTNAFDESGHHQETSTSANVGYVNLASPQDSYQTFAVTNTRRQASFREAGDSTHSLELLSTHSTASATPAQTRLASRKALRSALEALVTKPSGDGPAMLTVNAHRYFFGSGVKVEETPFAFFIDCRVAANSTEDGNSEPAPPVTLVLKIFIEDDADLAGRESYALSCLQHDELTRAFAPRLYDTALEYELVLGNTNDDVEAVTLNCCILVLETPSCTTLRAHMATSRESLAQQISRVVSALRALHGRGLVHGALHANSLVACSPDARLKFWGLEHASRAGHKVPCPDPDLLETWQAECVAPELAALVLEEKHSSRASPSLDVWSLGMMILKMHASGRQLEEFMGCTTPHDVFDRLTTSDLDSELSNTCCFERSITKLVPNIDMKDLLRQCLQRNPTSRLSVDSISKHKIFQAKEREVSRTTTVKSAVVSRMLSAIIEEKDTPASSEPEREASGKDQVPEKILDRELEDVANCDDTEPEPLPPSLWLFLPPVELEIDLTQRASFYSVDQWVSKLKRLQQQRGEELQFPLVFMCESCEANAAVPCSIATTAKSGATVTTSLLSLVMPLVRETMLFLEARAILSNGLSVAETSGLSGPREWEELRTFYQALERMELATLNPVNEVELAPMEQQLKTQDPTNAQQVLDVLSALIFSEDKREYVRNLLDALVSDESLSSSRAERSSWATLRRCDTVPVSSSALGRTHMAQAHEEAAPSSPLSAPAAPSMLESLSSLVAQTDDIEVVKDEENLTLPPKEHVATPRASLPRPRLSATKGSESSEPRPSIVNIVATEVATFYDVFGFLGTPMIIVFLLSAAWTFMLAAIQVDANFIANAIMNTTHFDNGQFWLLPKPEAEIVISSTVLLLLFGVGYLALAITMVFFYRSGRPSEEDVHNNASNQTTGQELTQAHSTPPRNTLHRLLLWVHHLPVDVRQHYFTAALDLPKLIFQSLTLYTYLQDGFPTPIIYCYAVLLLLNWLVACYRSQHYVNDPNLIIARLYYTFDLFFAVFAPLVVLVYFITSFQFDRAEFMTRMETLTPSTFDNVARIFGNPAQISSFCSAFHYLQFSSGDTLFYKSALNLLSLYKWRKIILTLIRNYHERELERKRKALVGPVSTDSSRKSSLKAIVSKALSVSRLKPKAGKHFVPKLLLSLVFFVWGMYNFVFTIGCVRSTQDLCRKYTKCAVPSYQWNFGHKHCTCLVFADRLTSPKTYAEWIGPEDTTSNLADLAVAGELRIVQIINRAVPALPVELKGCHSLQQLILVYTKTEYLPDWMSEFTNLEYIHVEGDFTSRRLVTIAEGIFDNMPHLTFLHLGTIPNVEKLPSLSSLKNLRYLALAVLDSLPELPSFEGLSAVSDLSIIHAPRAAVLPSLKPLTSMTSFVIRARSACLPIAGEKYPLTCTDARISVEDEVTIKSLASPTICPASPPLDREKSAPSKLSTDELCNGVKYKECTLNDEQGICYNTRMMVIQCETTAAYIAMRKLQIKRGVGQACNPDVESPLETPPDGKRKLQPAVNEGVKNDATSPSQGSSLEALDAVPFLVLQTDDIATAREVVHRGEQQQPPPSPSSANIRSIRPSSLKHRLSRPTLSQGRPSVVNAVAAEVTTFYEVFGVLGVPMLILFGVSAAWTFMLAAHSVA
ncbi:hypothetical protein ON010_g4498 [Phytophthora cinnamomi]|nr:hypothetical protein ON010_g4498 [Phytophthora cinnamomi]